MMRWAENVGRIEEKWTHSLVVNFKRPLGRSRRIWENNNKISFYEMYCNVVEWMYLTHDVDRLSQNDSSVQN